MLKRAESIAESESGVAVRSDSQMRRYAALIFDLCCIFVLAAAPLLLNLGEHSLGMTDEVYEVTAAQEMALSGRWFLPTVHGQPFFDKPPFKMWLTAIPVSLFGPSNWSYRAVDVFFGFATLLLSYAFARTLFASRIVGLLSVFLFLGCRIFVAEHGMRHAVQDSTLVFFSTAASIFLWCWHVELRHHMPRRRVYGYAALAAVCGALGFLTKTAAAAMPFIVFGAYLILSGALFSFLRKGAGPIALFLFCFLLLAGSYPLYHCTMTPGACHGMFYHHVFKRFHGGIHNVSGPWFYWIRLVEHRAAFAPELIALAFGYAMFRVLRESDKRYLFLLCWSVIPLLLYSGSSTKLSWYIAPAFPAIALLIAVLLRDAGCVVARNWAAPPRRMRLVPLFAAALCLYSAVVSTLAYAANVELVSQRNQRIKADLLAEDIYRFKREQGRAPRILNYRAPKFAMDENNYRNMLLPFIVSAGTAEELSSVETPDFILSGMHEIPELSRRWPLRQFMALEPLRQRDRWLLAFSTHEEPELPHFTFWKHVIDFGDHSFSGLFGLGGPEQFHHLAVRFVRGPEASFLLPAAAPHVLLGAELWLNFAAQLASPQNAIELVVSINGRELKPLLLKDGRLMTHRLHIPAGMLQVGENAVLLRSRFAQRVVRSTERPLMLNWASLRLAQHAAMTSQKGDGQPLE